MISVKNSNPGDGTTDFSQIWSTQFPAQLGQAMQGWYNDTSFQSCVQSALVAGSGKAPEGSGSSMFQSISTVFTGSSLASIMGCCHQEQSTTTQYPLIQQDVHGFVWFGVPFDPPGKNHGHYWSSNLGRYTPFLDTPVYQIVDHKSWLSPSLQVFMSSHSCFHYCRCSSPFHIPIIHWSNHHLGCWNPMKIPFLMAKIPWIMGSYVPFIIPCHHRWPPWWRNACLTRRP